MLDFDFVFGVHDVKTATTSVRIRADTSLVYRLLRVDSVQAVLQLLLVLRNFPGAHTDEIVMSAGILKWNTPR